MLETSYLSSYETGLFEIMNRDLSIGLNITVRRAALAQWWSLSTCVLEALGSKQPPCKISTGYTLF